MTREEAVEERDRLQGWVADVNRQAPQVTARIQYLNGFLAALDAAPNGKVDIVPDKRVAKR
jgi:tRNA U34 5-methylaminomethyl-2-thiouridine-forming methyltransferase MnmC